MNITELFPDAPLIPGEAVKIGDTIAFSRDSQDTEITVFTVTSFTDRGDAFGGIHHLPPNYGAYLVRRPASALPTEQGAMVRILNPGRNASTYAGNVYKWESGRRLFRDYENSHKLTIEDIRNGEIEWEQVFYTTTDPEGIVDAEVLEDDGDGIPHNLIELTSGMYNGALLRYHAPSNHFRGMDPEGNPLSLTHATVAASDWIAAALIRGI